MFARKKIFFPIFGGSNAPAAPVSYAYGYEQKRRDGTKNLTFFLLMFRHVYWQIDLLLGLVAINVAVVITM